jgi:hypothetical protein
MANPLLSGTRLSYCGQMTEGVRISPSADWLLYRRLRSPSNWIATREHCWSNLPHLRIVAEWSLFDVREGTSCTYKVSTMVTAAGSGLMEMVDDHGVISFSGHMVCRS